MPLMLTEIVKNNHEKISDKWSSYLPFYQKHFSPYCDDSIRLLEIGVQNGGSLEIWSKFFPKAEVLIGCDINTKCGNLTYDDPRVRVFVGDAATEEMKDEISKTSPRFDIIIDDGSHRSDDIVKTFALYFPLLEPGGIYVAEDLHASYFETYQGGTEAPFSSLNFFKRLTDYVNIEHWGVDVSADSLLSYFSDHWNTNFDAASLDSITEVMFSNSLVLVRKGNAGDNALGHRMVTGKSALVDDRVTKMDNSAPLKPDESRNPMGPLGMRLESYPGEAARLDDALETMSDELKVMSDELKEKTDQTVRLEKQLSDQAETVGQLQWQNHSRDAEIEATRGHVKLVASELKRARRKPLEQLSKLLQYKLLRGLSKARPVVSERAAARFARSAAKRHPSRLPSMPETAVPPASPTATLPAVSRGETSVSNDFHRFRNREELDQATSISARLLPIAESGFWDERWYKDRHWDEIRAAAKRYGKLLSPLHHYILEGWKNGYEPSPFFPVKRRTDLDRDPVSHFLDTVQYDGYQFEENAWFPSAQDIGDYLANKELRKAKRVVYACIVGQYDDLIQPKFIDSSSDYVCFTDREDLLEHPQNGVWSIRPLVKTHDTATLTNRWHKMHPHALFPEYEESLYVDGNVNVLSSYIFETIAERGAEILLPRHFSRSCISEELTEIARSRRIDRPHARMLEDLIRSARSKGFPTGWGLSENNVIFRKHHDARIGALMEEWWDMTETVAPRDQAHFCYLLWKHGYSFEHITFPNCRGLYKDFAVVRHNTREEIQLRQAITHKLSPAFDHGAVAIVLSCNEAFVDFLDVLLTSIVENGSADRKYDIIILNRDVSDASKQRIEENHGSHANVSIRFHDMTHVLSALSDMDLHLEGYVPIETYNKIFLNDILEGYDKIAYIDTDIILDRDIADLYDIDLRGRAIGAALNVANIHAANAEKTIKDRLFHAYLQKDLGVLNVDRYFQAGILLLDLTHRNTQKLFRKCVEKIKEIKEPAFFDQCIFNSVFYGDVCFFSTEWNMVWYLQNYSYVRSTVPEELFFDYARAHNKPSIIHYASGDKPTNKTDWRLGDRFWEYAVRSKSKDALLGALSNDQRQSPQVAGVLAGQTLIPEMVRILVHVHLYYEDQLPFMMEAISNLGDFPRDVYFTIQKGSKIDKSAILEAEPGSKFIEVPNLGYDLFPFVEVLRRVNLSSYDYILKLHTKAPRTKMQGSVYGMSVPGYAWRDALVGALAGSPEIFRANIERMQGDRTIGTLACSDFIFSTHENNEEKTYDLRKWRSFLGVQSGNVYVGGTMFLARAFPFERFKTLHDRPELFKGGAMSTKSHKDFAHVVERLCGIVVENEGLTTQGVISGGDPTQK